MSKHVVLMKFTPQGLTDIQQSPDRAAAFKATAEKAGVEVEAQLWTAGAYDAILIINAPDEATAAGVVLGLSKTGNVSTSMLHAFDAAEFKTVLAKMG